MIVIVVYECNCVPLCVGSLPTELCAQSTLNFLTANSAGYLCYPTCLTTKSYFARSNIINCSLLAEPPNFQETALCSLVAATNFQTYYTQAVCSTNWHLYSDPCYWGMFPCFNGYVTGFFLSQRNITGRFKLISSECMSLIVNVTALMYCRHATNTIGSMEHAQFVYDDCN
jgi:hypothetical protein